MVAHTVALARTPRTLADTGDVTHGVMGPGTHWVASHCSDHTATAQPLASVWDLVTAVDTGHRAGTLWWHMTLGHGDKWEDRAVTWHCYSVTACVCVTDGDQWQVSTHCHCTTQKCVNYICNLELGCSSLSYCVHQNLTALTATKTSQRTFSQCNFYLHINFVWKLFRHLISVIQLRCGDDDKNIKKIHPVMSLMSFKKLYTS